MLERNIAPALASLMAQADENGALDVYVYRRAVRGVAVSMSFSVALVYFGNAAGNDDLLAIASGDGRRRVESVTLSTGEHAFRTLERRTVTAGEFRDETAKLLHDPAGANEGMADSDSSEIRDATRRTTRVSYLVPIPGLPGSCLLMVFDCIDGPLAEAQVFHFDAVVSTLGWV